MAADSGQLRRRRRYVSWDEVVVSNDKGRRVVHYYLRGAGGGADLAVVGRERSVRHMSYAVPNGFAERFVGGIGGALRWRSRREVVDWLENVVADSVTYGSSHVANRIRDSEDAEPAELANHKDISSRKMEHGSKNFMWLGAAWTCRKRKNHYRSFCRNGVTIKVHDFVYVISEENRRLVAYVVDLYEDLRGNNMVAVRWFHKVDEVGILLPPDVNEREIFFSLCLQDFSVECIDGLAAVLSAQHYKLFLDLRRRTKWEPFLCCRQIDIDDVKPFDVTQVQGYWSQELLRSLFTSPLKLRFKIKNCSSVAAAARNGDMFVTDSEMEFQLQTLDNTNADNTVKDKVKYKSSATLSKSGKPIANAIAGSVLLRKELFKQKLQPNLSRGCHVEVLSQDSGLRGCWFHCVVVKRHQDKIKVRYQDVKDPDEIDNLEEWVSLSRMASSDGLGIRLSGRPLVRPYRTHRGLNWSNLDVGAVVDAWCHDGWWEGVLVDKEDGKLHVYFPGEKRFSSFTYDELRESQDWVNNKWNAIECWKDVASSLLIDMKSENKSKISGGKIHFNPTVIKEFAKTEPSNTLSRADKIQDCTTSPNSSTDEERSRQDLTKDWQFDCLKWSSLKKRKRRRELDRKIAVENERLCEVQASNGQDMTSDTQSSFLPPKSANVDNENCKVGGDPLFTTPMPISSLVMSQ